MYIIINFTILCASIGLYKKAAAHMEICLCSNSVRQALDLMGISHDGTVMKWVFNLASLL